jgi:hypothetical protein
VSERDGQGWGPAFEAPVFCDDEQVLGQRLVADKHLKLRMNVKDVSPGTLATGRYATQDHFPTVP